MNQSLENGFCPKCGALMRLGVCQSCEFSVKVNPMPQYTYQGQGFSNDMMMGTGIPSQINASKKNKVGLAVGIIIAGVCIILAIVVVILIAMYILANSAHISEKKPDIVRPKEDEYIYDYDEEKSDFVEEDFSDNYNFNENSDTEIPPLDEEIWGDVWDDFEKYEDEYPMITDYIRDDLSYSVYFEKFEDEDKTVQCTYPVIEGEKEYVPYLNQMFNRFAEETKTVAEKYQCTATSDSYVTYMDEEVMSVIFIEVYSFADKSTFECIYCYTMDIESGGLIEFELKDDSDEVLFEMEKRCREQSTDDAEHIFTTYSKDDIRTFLKETDNSFVAFFTPYGMEIGLCYEGYWCCATFKDYEEYVMIAQNDETEF